MYDGVWFLKDPVTTEIYTSDTRFPYTSLFRSAVPIARRVDPLRLHPGPAVAEPERGGAIAPIGDERPPLAIGHRAAGEGMRRQKRGKARTFTVECKAVARMSDIHDAFGATDPAHRSEEHTSGLQSLLRLSYAVFCLKKKTTRTKKTKKQKYHTN